MVDRERDVIMTEVSPECPAGLDQERDELPYICACASYALKYCGCTGQTTISKQP